jgi:hypothetical protein
VTAFPNPEDAHGPRHIVKKAREFSKPFRVTKGEAFRLKEVYPGDALDLKSEDKPRAKEALATGVDALASLDVKYPAVGAEKLKELAAAKRALQAER